MRIYVTGEGFAPDLCDIDAVINCAARVHVMQSEDPEEAALA